MFFIQFVPSRQRIGYKSYTPASDITSLLFLSSVGGGALVPYWCCISISRLTPSPVAECLTHFKDNLQDLWTTHQFTRVSHECRMTTVCETSLKTVSRKELPEIWSARCLERGFCPPIVQKGSSVSLARRHCWWLLSAIVYVNTPPLVYVEVIPVYSKQIVYEI